LKPVISVAGVRKIGRVVSYWFSIFVRSRTAFLVLMIAAALFKLLLSSLAPASFSLREIIRWVEVSVSVGPWVTLDAQIYSFWRTVTLSKATAVDWWSTAPTAMSSDLRLLSLLLRLPSFIFDAAIAIALYSFVLEFASKRGARLASLLWFLNPYTLFAVEMLGVPDVATAFLSLLAVTFLCKRRIILASLFLAGGIAIKFYPVLLLPPILLYCRRILKTERGSELALVSLSLLGLAAYLTWDFQFGSALVIYVLTEYTSVTQPMSELFQYIAATRISPAAVVLIVLYFAIWLLAKTDRITDLILPVFLIYYTFSDPYPQYYVWALPFLVLDIVLLKRRHLGLLTMLLAFVFGYWFISSNGFLTPSGYSLLLLPLDGSSLPWYSQLIRSFLKSSSTSYLLAPLLYAGLGATTFIYALEIMRFWFRPKVKESRSLR